MFIQCRVIGSILIGPVAQWTCDTANSFAALYLSSWACVATNDQDVLNCIWIESLIGV